MLVDTFQVQGTVGLIDLRRKFFSHQMTNGEDVEEHICKMREWYQQINNISPSACSEVDWIMTLVSNLPDSWDAFTQSVDFSFDLGDKNLLANKVADLRARILAEAHHRNTRNDNRQAFFSTDKTRNQNNNSRTFNPRPAPRVTDKSKTACNNCGRLGHWAAECRQPGGGAHTDQKRNPPNAQPNRGGSSNQGRFQKG